MPVELNPIAFDVTRKEDVSAFNVPLPDLVLALGPERHWSLLQARDFIELDARCDTAIARKEAAALDIPVNSGGAALDRGMKRNPRLLPESIGSFVERILHRELDFLGLSHELKLQPAPIVVLAVRGALLEPRARRGR